MTTLLLASYRLSIPIYRSTNKRPNGMSGAPTRSNLMKAHHLALEVALAYCHICVAATAMYRPSGGGWCAMPWRRQRGGSGAARRPASLMERKKEGKKGPSGQERRKPSLNLYDSGLVQLAMKANAGYLTSAVLCSSPSEICRRLCKFSH